MLNIDEKSLCARLCADVSIVRRANDKLMLKTPFHYPDGDNYPLYLSETATGGVRISDGGHTLMHLSYENDIDKFFEGTRSVLMGQVVSQDDVSFNDESGEFYVESALDDMAEAVFRLGQSITRIYDLTFLNRSHVASTFYDDLKESITALVDEERVKANYVVPGLPAGENYPVDFCIETGRTPLFLYGVPNRDKARLTTIFLQYLLQHGIEFDSLLVFEDQQEIPRADLARLSNVGGEMISSLNAEDDFKRKLLRRVA